MRQPSIRKCISVSASQESPAPTSAGFTLIELLVVFAIIAILAALLLPTLSRAKVAGRSATCRSNLHQIGLALQMYVDDHRYYPGLEHTAPSPGVSGPAAVFQLQPYLSEVVFRCPVPEDNPSGIVVTVGTRERQTVVSHGAYGYNAFGCAPNTTRLRVGLGGIYSDEEQRWRLVSEAAVRSPAGTIAFGDAAPLGMVIAPVVIENYLPISLPSRRHSLGANLLFCDGHVEYKKQIRWIEASEEARQQWNVDHEPHAKEWK